MYPWLNRLKSGGRRLKTVLLSPWTWLTIGLSVAVLCAMKPSANHLLFADSLVGYCAGLTVAIAGLVKLWQQRLTQQHDHIAQFNQTHLTQYIQLLETLLQSLQQLPPADPAQLTSYCQQLRQLRTHCILPMSQINTAFIQQGDFEMLVVLTVFARGERLLNRCLSAALEGYDSEVNRVLPESIAAFNQVHQQLLRLEME